MMLSHWLFLLHPSFIGGNPHNCSRKVWEVSLAMLSFHFSLEFKKQSEIGA